MEGVYRKECTGYAEWESNTVDRKEKWVKLGLIIHCKSADILKEVLKHLTRVCYVVTILY